MALAVPKPAFAPFCPTPIGPNPADCPLTPDIVLDPKANLVLVLGVYLKLYPGFLDFQARTCPNTILRQPSDGFVLQAHTRGLPGDLFLACCYVCLPNRDFLTEVSESRQAIACWTAVIGKKTHSG